MLALPSRRLSSTIRSWTVSPSSATRSNLLHSSATVLRRVDLLDPKGLKTLLDAKSDKPPVVLDASWFMPNLDPPRSGWKEFKGKRIPGSGFFDLDIIASKDERGLAHMLPSADMFADACSRLGISRTDTVVFLDSHGIFSSPRAAWTFKVFGHEKLSILNGGLPAWEAAGLPIDTELPIPPNPHSTEPGSETKYQPIMSVLLYDHKPRIESYFIADVEEHFGDYPVPETNTSMVASWQKVDSNARNTSSSDRSTVLDARATLRFDGTAPEPRKGLSSGHIPHSLSLPFSKLLSTPPKSSSTTKPTFQTLLSPKELEKVFEDTLGKEGWKEVKSGEREVIATCGSGMTAAIIDLGLEQAGRKRNAVLYDESWTGYASRPESIIEKSDKQQ